MKKRNLEYIYHVFNSIPDEILVMDNEMRVREANASFLENRDLDMDRVRGQRCCDLGCHVRADCDESRDDCPFQEIMRGKPYVYTVRQDTDASGAARYTALVAAPVKDEEGRTVGLIEMTRDVTRRKILERQLAATERQLKRFLEAAPAATFIKDREGRYLDANQAGEALLGRAKEEILGKSDLDFFAPESAGIFGRDDDRIFAEKQDLSYNAVLERGSGQVYWSITKFPILDANGDAAALCVICDDITAQREAEHEVKRTTEYLQNILDIPVVIIVAVDEEGQILTFNRGAEKALGYSFADAVQMHSKDLFFDPRERDALIRRLRTEETVVDQETQLKRSDGTPLPVSMTLSKMQDSRGRILGTTAVAKDISHRKALQDQIMLSERQAAVGRLAAGVAHEINNPLALIGEIAGYLNDLATGGPGAESADLLEELREGLPRILKQIKRGRSITSRMLNFARKTVAVIRVAEVHAALDEILPFLEKEARMARVTIHKDLGEGVLRVAIEELQLQEIVINLVKNAIQAMREDTGSNIWLTTKALDRKVSITVRDDGPGIDQSVRDRIFDPFVTTKPPGQGTGLGLSICYGIVKRFDGEIRVDSELGRGTSFQIILPVAAGND